MGTFPHWIAAIRHSMRLCHRLGHSSVAFTLDTYGHVQPGDQRAALDRLFGGS